MRAVKARRVFGQLEHPKDGKSDLKEAAIVVTEVTLRPDGEVYGTLETLSTEAGKTATALFKDGLSIGISSRAEGSVVRRGDGIDEVQEDFRPETFDLVAEPSTPGALLHESLQETLSKRKPEDIKNEERIAMCEVQIDALKTDIFKARKYDRILESRLNDLKFSAKTITGNSAIPMAIGILSEALLSLKPKGKLKEEEATDVEPAEVTPEPVPEIATKDPAAATPPISSYKKLELLVDIGKTPDDIKKKINVFRPGEDLTTAGILAKAEVDGMGVPVKEVEVTWQGDSIKICVEFDGDELAIHDKLCALFGVCSSTTAAATTEAPPLSPEEETAVHEAVMREVLDELNTAKKKLANAITENANLRTLHNAMVEIFESEFVNLEAKAMIREYPPLQKFEKVLLSSKSRATLHESAKLFLSAIGIESRPRKEAPARNETTESTAAATSGKKIMESLQIPESISLTEAVSDGIKKDTAIPVKMDTFSRLAAHKNKNK